MGWVDLQPGHPVTCQYGLYDHERVLITEAVQKRFGEEPSRIREPPSQVNPEALSEPEEDAEEKSTIYMPEDFLS